MKRREMEMEVEKEGKETGPHHHTSVIAFSSHVLSIRGGFTDLTPDVWFPWREREREAAEGEKQKQSRPAQSYCSAHKKNMGNSTGQGKRSVTVCERERDREAEEKKIVAHRE